MFFEETKRILVINVNWIGDVLLSTPSLWAIRERFPHAHIACFVVSGCGDVLVNNPHIDELLLYDKKGKHKHLLGKFKLLNSIRRHHFDTVFVFHRSRTRALLAYLSGAKYRIGYNTKKRGFLLTTKIAPPGKGLHKVDYFLGIVQALEPSLALKTPKELVLRVSEEDKASVRNLLEKHNIGDNDFLVGLNPGANWAPKRWSASGFAKVGDGLVKRYNAKIIITGKTDDDYLAEEISGMMEEECLNFTGKTTLRELPALIKRCKLFISADSGPMHMAVAMKTPLVALFGPTQGEETGPYGSGPYVVVQKKTECAPCWKLVCRDNRCMKNITPEDVLGAVERIVQNSLFERIDSY